MLDLTQITGPVQSFLGGSEVATNPLLAAISAAGLDIETLQGLAPEQLIQVLGEHGVDLSAFAPDQLGALASSLGLEVSDPDGIGNVLEQFLR